MGVAAAAATEGRGAGCAENAGRENNGANSTAGKTTGQDRNRRGHAHTTTSGVAPSPLTTTIHNKNNVDSGEDS